MISSTANPTIKRLAQLHERRGRLHQGLYLMEGVRLVEEALDGDVRPATVLVAPDLLRATARGRALHERLRHEPDARAVSGAVHDPIEVSAAVLRHVSGAETPAGIVAALPRLPLADLASLPAAAGLVLVLDGIGDPGNAGTILRSAAAAGIDGVAALSGCADLYAPKVVRAAMGAHLRVPLAVDVTLAQLESWLPARGQAILADVHAPASVYDHDLRVPTVLIVGGEAHGARQTGVLAGVQPVSIPMPGAAESLNAAVAAAVILFEAVRQRAGGQ